MFYDWFFAADQSSALTIRERVTNHTYNMKGQYRVNVTARNEISSKVMHISTVRFTLDESECEDDMAF